jgi:ferredoxin
MAMVITDDCINCGACASECPVEAIYEPNEKYEFDGKIFEPVSDEHFFISQEICNGCEGLNEMKCVSICPMDAIKENDLVKGQKKNFNYH